MGLKTKHRRDMEKLPWITRRSLMLKLDFLQKYMIMLLKAELGGLHYTFPKWKNFYSNLKNIIKIALEKLRGRNRKNQHSSAAPAEAKPAAAVDAVPGTALQSNAADLMGTTQKSSWGKAAGIPNREKRWERGNNFLFLPIYNFDSGQPGYHNYCYQQNNTKIFSCLMSFACVKGEL